MQYMTDSFYAALLGALGAPDTVGNYALFDAWSRKEGTSARNNPLATTEHYGASTMFNTAGVQNFSTEADGVAATAATLTNGYYPNIVDYVKYGRGDLAAAELDELTKWGSGQLPYDGPTGDAAAALRNPPPAAPAPADVARVLRVRHPMLRGDDVTAVQDALAQRGYNLGPAGVDGIYGPATAAAVTAFQTDAAGRGADLGPTGADGVVGPFTRAALGI